MTSYYVLKVLAVTTEEGKAVLGRRDILIAWRGTITSSEWLNNVRDALRGFMNKYRDEEISITVVGFSLGGALATLNAMDIVANGYNITNGAKKSPLRSSSRKRCNSQYLKWRWFGSSSHVSPEFFPSSDEITMEEEMAIKEGLGEHVSAHNMDVYLHGIAGVQEQLSEFCLQVDHDIARINKHLDQLKDCCGIPTVRIAKRWLRGTMTVGCS
ncbi:phospholipase A1-II 1-like [Hibiscus syriacus]|uniref:phospholipase A1-II 1-like n=1 Tax=Hibiscus syriacus TaxID=106335 RepID=UPI0019215CCE|nr:phospholipase A1-II 1-like [Hibiscus syriacus]